MPFMPFNPRRTITPSILLLRTATEISNYTIPVNEENETNNDGENNERVLCSICRVNLDTDDIIRTINHCGHHYHINCLDRWFEDHITCPICRYDIRGTATATANTVEETVSVERITIPLNAVGRQLPPN